MRNGELSYLYCRKSLKRIIKTMKLFSDNDNSIASAMSDIQAAILPVALSLNSHVKAIRLFIFPEASLKLLLQLYAVSRLPLSASGGPPV